MNPADCLCAASCLIAAAFVLYVAWGVARDLRHATGRAPLHRRVRARLTSRFVRVPRYGRPLSDDELHDFDTAMRGWGDKAGTERWALAEQAVEQELREAEAGQ